MTNPYLIHIYHNEDFYELLMKGTLILRITKTSGPLDRIMKFDELHLDVKEKIISAVAEKLTDHNG